MKTTFNFEVEPFEAYSEFDEYAEEQPGNYSEFDQGLEEFDTEMAELGWGGEASRRPRPAVPRARPGGRVVSTKRPIKRPPRPPIRPPRPAIFPTIAWPAVSVVEPRPPQPPAPAGAEPTGTEPAPAGGPPTSPSAEPPAEGSEYVRWVQDSLNRILGLRLPLDGIMGPETRSAIRSFQERQKLPVTGLVGPDTERTLMAATASVPTSELEELELFGTELADQEWEEEINRNSAEYIRWVQQSLNQILGLRLAVDGIIGRQTRSAIRSFQQRAGLTVDGVAGPRTEAALRAAGATAPPGGPSPAPGTTARPDIVRVRGIQVARQIAPQVEGLLAAAEADGVRLSGWGYRSTERQIELRRKHCGTSHYDIWEKPSSECTPPTARPGRSMHERGLAIDFTYNGHAIGSRDTPGFQWLAGNAARFGLKNLPSEPWHWSVNGR